MNDRDSCLASAAECERLARRAASLEEWASLMCMAQLWRKLADSRTLLDRLDDASAPQARSAGTKR